MKVTDYRNFDFLLMIGFFNNMEILDGIPVIKETLAGTPVTLVNIETGERFTGRIRHHNRGNQQYVSIRNIPADGKYRVEVGNLPQALKQDEKSLEELQAQEAAEEASEGLKDLTE